MLRRRKVVVAEAVRAVDEVPRRLHLLREVADAELRPVLLLLLPVADAEQAAALPQRLRAEHQEAAALPQQPRAAHREVVAVPQRLLSRRNNSAKASGGQQADTIR